MILWSCSSHFATTRLQRLTRLRMESKAQGRQSRKIEPMWVLVDTVEPLYQTAAALFEASSMRLWNTYRLKQVLFNCSVTCSPKLSNSIFQVNFKTLSTFYLIHIHNVDSWRSILWGKSQDTWVQAPPLSYTQCVALGKSLNLCDPRSYA